MTPELPTMRTLYIILISAGIIATLIIIWILNKAEEMEDEKKGKKDNIDDHLK